MEAENEGQQIDLVSEMQAIKGEVQKDLETENFKKEILKQAVSVEGVKEASEGEIEITDAVTGTTAEAATRVPEVDSSPAPVPAPAPAPAPALAPAPAPDVEPLTSDTPVSAAIHPNALASLFIGIV